MLIHRGKLKKICPSATLSTTDSTWTLLGSRSQVSSVSTESYGLDFRDSITDKGKSFFCSPERPDRLWGPASLLSNGNRGFFPLGLKRPGREGDRSPPSGTEVKNCWATRSFRRLLHGVVLN
jgi:hypothetical protein